MKTTKSFRDIENNVILKLHIQASLKTLSAEEQQVIKLRFGFPDGGCWSLQSIGDIKNLTRERVRQIEAKALRKLRHRMLKD